MRKWDTRSTATIAVNGTTDHRRQVTTHPGRLFTRLPATESGVASVGPTRVVNRHFSDLKGLPL